MIRSINENSYLPKTFEKFSVLHQSEKEMRKGQEVLFINWTSYQPQRNNFHTHLRITELLNFFLCSVLRVQNFIEKKKESTGTRDQSRLDETHSLDVNIVAVLQYDESKDDLDLRIDFKYLNFIWFIKRIEIYAN